MTLLDLPSCRFVGTITPMAVVAIGLAESLSATEVAWSLVDAGFKVFAFSRKGRDSGSSS